MHPCAKYVSSFSYVFQRQEIINAIKEPSDSDCEWDSDEEDDDDEVCDEDETKVGGTRIH